MNVLRMLQAYKAPSPLSVNTLVPICYLYSQYSRNTPYMTEGRSDKMYRYRRGQRSELMPENSPSLMGELMPPLTIHSGTMGRKLGPTRILSRMRSGSKIG